MTSGKEIVVIGGGGHAKVVISTLEACGFVVRAVFDDDSSKWGTMVLGTPIEGRSHNPSGAALIAIGNNSKRRDFASLDYDWQSAIHPRATVHPSVILGAGTIVFAGAVIQPGVVIGKHVIVNTGATIDHDCTVGDFAHIAPGSHLAGEVQVGEGALLGIGAVVTPRIKIGAWSTVGAGSAVVHDVAAEVVAFGVPAKPRTTKKS